MTYSTVFINNRTQAVRIPAELRFADEVKIVNVRVVGNERIISPAQNIWDSFFLTDPPVSEDFLEHRPSQEQPKRESF
ncbi:type II toxin-antitoxin system VapB family antitoxin [Acerihabitans arboris]|uniref:AbrB/MazE/SpoVT family DNA-binding domain-containing protein n=1 Tax=Acerihabitans arboris TaxID=2691583 RepID=A0A845SNZ0_9GAMM|nr:type II toxin-antitoxin system VapB family antitoxin [Acerihabitans arboris]NDL65092.1 AbrB/MazE/SpoVT family DNA-binding domain-containing protein [Acerihabitans arboris]